MVKNNGDEIYPVDVKKGGLILVDSGEYCGGKAIRSVVKDSAECSVTVTFTDGCVYKLMAKRTDSGNKVTLTDISETWTNKDGTTTLERK